MRFCRQLVPQVIWALALASAPVWADPDDVESSHDYTGFPRLPGFVISDYDEDNPAEFDFPVARPVPIDASHIEKVHVNGHRYAIRYELSPGSHATPLFQTQQYYEKLARDAGFTAEKTGAVGDVTETFYKASGTRAIWVYLEPAVMVNVITVVESSDPAPPPPLHMAAPPPAATDSATAAATSPNSSRDTPAVPATLPDSSPPALPTEQSHDALYAALNEDGRVVVPFVFQPGKDELDESSQPLVDRVVAMMKAHPDLFLRIEGHTDNTGDPEDNLRLSAQRALAIEAKLIDASIDKKRLDAVGVGGLQPLADNNTAEGREKNRRIELVMWKKYPASHVPAANEGDNSSSHPGVPILNNDPTFHPPAPNGNNYYPDSSSSAKNGL